jgi:hypothetical protein
MSEDLLVRGTREGLEAYITRLEGIDRAGLSEDEELALALSLRVARKKLHRLYLGAEIPDVSPLEHCKQEIRRLSRAERRQLVRWLTEDQPNERRARGGKAS